MKKLKIILTIFLVLGIVGCATDSQNQYSEGDIGKQTEVEFGKIIAFHEVKIQGKNTGVGALAGGAAGAAGGSAFGKGNGQVYSALGGLLVGAIAGAVAEHELQNRKGIEYTITKRNGKTVTIVQNIAKDDQPLRVGQRVMIQTSGEYMRVLPTDNFPDKIKRPKDIQVTD